MTAIPQIRLTGRAARFVELLGEYGHLDTEALNRVLLGAAELDMTGGAEPVDVDVVRRAAAMVLFPALEIGDAALVEDWPRLFS